MATNIKGITIEIGGDTTGLDKALKGVDKQLNSTQKNLKDIDKALKLDPKNTELMAQKQKALADAVKQTSDRLKTLKEAQKQAAAQLARGDIGQEQYDALTREIVKTEVALKDASKAAADFALQSKGINVTLSELSTSAGNVAEKTKTISAVGAGIVGGLAAAAIKTGQWADELKTLAQQTGLTTTEIQKMQYASDLVDVSVDSMTGALAKLTRNMADTGGQASQAFDRLGVSVVGVDGQMRSSEEVFYATLQALSLVRNETERDQLAMQIFGRSANELAGIIDDGGEALRRYGEEAQNNGSIIEEELVNSMNAFNDKIDAFKAKAVPQLLQTGGSAIEALTPTIETLIGAVSGLLSIIGSLDPTLIQVIATLALFAASISPIASGISMLGQAISFFTAGGLTQLATMLGTTGGQLTAIIGLLGLFAMLVAQIVNAWDDMTGWEKAIAVMGSLVVAATAAAIALGAFQSAASMGIAAAAIVAGIVAVTAAVNAATKRKNEANTRGIPMMANGGELWQGSAIVGEAGPELLTMANGHAVVQPLTNNTYNTTTNNYGSRQPQVIQVTLDGRVLAQQLFGPMEAVKTAHGPQFTR